MHTRRAAPPAAWHRRCKRASPHVPGAARAATKEVHLHVFGRPAERTVRNGQFLMQGAQPSTDSAYCGVGVALPVVVHRHASGQTGCDDPGPRFVRALVVYARHHSERRCPAQAHHVRPPSSFFHTVCTGRPAANSVTIHGSSTGPWGDVAITRPFSPVLTVVDQPIFPDAAASKSGDSAPRRDPQRGTGAPPRSQDRPAISHDPQDLTITRWNPAIRLTASQVCSYVSHMGTPCAFLPKHATPSGSSAGSPWRAAVRQSEGGTSGDRAGPAPVAGRGVGGSQGPAVRIGAARPRLLTSPRSTGRGNQPPGVASDPRRATTEQETGLEGEQSSDGG